jgi:hypothetical protein
MGCNARKNVGATLANVKKPYFWELMLNVLRIIILKIKFRYGIVSILICPLMKKKCHKVVTAQNITSEYIQAENPTFRNSNMQLHQGTSNVSDYLDVLVMTQKAHKY